MPPSRPRTITRLLERVRAGDGSASDALLSEVYGELTLLARQQLASERKNHTLQPTALVHEAWLKFESGIERIDDRRHFFALASRAMRQVLTDHARGKNRRKRDGTHRRVTLEGLEAGGVEIEFVELDDSLERLADLNSRHARVVELRVFGGMTIADTAAVLGVSHTTVETDWVMARAWLRKELSPA